MSKETTIIRKIKQSDNRAIETIIKDIFPEFGMPLIGTAYEDLETTQMFESYQEEREVYFVIEENGLVIGGAGIKGLKNCDETICELQKMYFKPAARGKGYGKIMFEKCLKAAKELGYDKCYLESASVLEVAIRIYEKNGFKHLNEPMGGTGHFSCGVWMIKDL